MTEPPDMPIDAPSPEGPVHRLVAAETDVFVSRVSWNSSGDRLMVHGADIAQILRFGSDTGPATLRAEWTATENPVSAVWSRSRPNLIYALTGAGLVCLDTATRSVAWRDRTSRDDLRAVSHAHVPGLSVACLGDGDDELIAVLPQVRGGISVHGPDGRRVHTYPHLCSGMVAAPQAPAVLAQSADNQRILRLDLRSGAEQDQDAAGELPAFWMSWSRHDDFVAVAREDGTIRIHDGLTLGHLATLEGHLSAVFAVDFSHDGRLLASMSNDHTVRLWRTGSWQCVAVLRATVSGSFGGVAFHPAAPLLACRGSGNREVVVLRYDIDALLDQSTALPRRYLNAKVVLVGDTGVGKSGLGLRLSGQDFRPTESSHSRSVASASIEEVRAADGAVETREIMIWDLAGQPGYRIVHQLHLTQSAAAVIVFDARSEADPTAGVAYWQRAIHNSGRLRVDGLAGIPTVLAAGRADRGGVALPRKRIDELVEDMRFTGFVETSAKEGWGIDELRRRILDAIDWDRLPWSASTELFDRIKTYLWEEKNAGRVLTTAADLLREFVRRHPDLGDADNLRPSFTTCVQLLEGRDVLRRLTFGNYILLRPEALDAYASALINAARSEPDGLGFVPETKALAGEFRMPSEERLPDQAEQRILLIATVEELLRHDLVLREDADLVFPSQFTRNRTKAPEQPPLDVVFALEGAVLNIYAALAVRLSHIGLYHRAEMYRNTATFPAKVGGICGISLAETGEGRAELGLFFTGAATEETRYLFEDYVRAHIEERAAPGSVKRRRVFRCPAETCAYEIPKNLVERWEQANWASRPCPACSDAEITLLDRERRLSAATSERISSMNDHANRQRDLAVAATTVKGKEETNTFDVFISYHSGDRDEALDIATRLLRRGIRPWLDIWEIAPGRRWQSALAEQIGSIQSVAVLIGDQGMGRWQELEGEAFVSEFMKRRCRIIPVFLATAGSDTALPPMLAEWQAADFRTARPDPVSQLIWGITGDFPQEAR